MKAFIDDQRGVYGLFDFAQESRSAKPCRSLRRPIANMQLDGQTPTGPPARERREASLCENIGRVFEANFEVYGICKVWRQLRREGIDAARWTLARLMRQTGLKGAVRGKSVRTTIGNLATPCQLERMNRQFKAPCPNTLWVSDFTYVATGAGPAGPRTP